MFLCGRCALKHGATDLDLFLMLPSLGRCEICGREENIYNLPEKRENVAHRIGEIKDDKLYSM